MEQQRADMEWDLTRRAKDDNTRAALVELDRLRHEAPIAKAIDDYLLMERKARAWDKLADELKAEVLKHRDRDAQLMLERMGIKPPNAHCRSCRAPTKGGALYCGEGCEAEHARALRVAADLRRAAR